MKAMTIYKSVLREIKRETELRDKKQLISMNKLISADNWLYLFTRKITTQKIRSYFGKYIFNDKKNTYKYTIDEYSPLKLIAYDFIEYIIANNPIIPSRYFPHKDTKKLERFIRSLIYSAYFNELTPKMLGVENCSIYVNAYNKNNKVKTKKGYFEYRGFKSIKPYFESIFHNYGLDQLNNGGEIHSCFDLGAYIGDTAYLINKMIKPKMIYAIEPQKENFSVLSLNLALNNLENIVIPVQIAMGSAEGHCFIDNVGSASKKSKTGKGSRVKMTTIDNFVNIKNILKVSLIKMDIEGGEMDVLTGAIKTIKRDLPDLIISVYHKPEHYFLIPGWLKKNFPKYNLRFVEFSEASPLVERVILASTRKI